MKKLIASAVFVASSFLLPVENASAVASLNLSTSFVPVDSARANYMDQAGTWNGSAEVTNSTINGDRFTLRIDNTAVGTTTAFDVDITLALPTGFRLPNTGSTPVTVTSPNGCNTTTGQTDYTPLTAGQSGLTVNFNIPNNRNIPAGCIYDFEFGLTTRDSSPFPNGGANNFTYTVDYDDGGPGLQTPTVQTVQINPGVLALTKTAITSVATNGSAVDFRIDIRNTGTGGAFQVVLTDTFPSTNFVGVTFTSFNAFDDTTNAPLPVPAGSLTAANQYTFNYIPPNMRIEVGMRTTASVNPLATTCPVMVNDAESVQRTTQSSSNFASVDFNLPNSLQLTYEASSYCELCSTGVVQLTVANAGGLSLTNISIVSDLLASGLTYAGSTQIALSFDGTTFGAPIAANDPVLSGGSNQILTWSPAEISQLAQLDSPFATSPPNPVSIRFIFQVRRNTAQGFTEQGLVTDPLISRNIEARSTYDLICGGPTQNTISNLFELPLRQPIPVTTKLGRNVDAAQSAGNYAPIIYGHVDDDIIWRVDVQNIGLADMQDLLIDDSITGSNFDINYVCNSEASATLAAAGTPPGVSCVSAGGGVRTSVLNFPVDDPFGNPANDEPTTFVDVPTAGNGFIYYVGRIRQQCSNQTNTADIEWGCEINGPDGGITIPGSTGGAVPANTIISAANMSANVVASGLGVTVNMTGSNQAQPLGTKGVVTIVIANNTGGTVRLWNGPNAMAGVDVDPVTDDNSDTSAGSISFTDILPVEYVMDTTFTPTAVMATAYGVNYNGMVDSIVHTNPITAPLANTSPRFRLYSSTQDTDPVSGTVYEHMIRNGDVLTIQFGVVLVNAPRFDLVADLDIAPEVNADGTDPDNTFTVNNQFTLNALSYCSANPTINVNASYPANLEDLDVNTSDALYILTSDLTTPLTLTTLVTNNGGHDADDYSVYITFGESMTVQTVPAGCAITTNPPPNPLWNQPAFIPPTANVYLCDRGVIAPGATQNFSFTVIRNTTAVNDDLTFRADVVGEITLSDSSLLTFPTPVTLTNTTPGLQLANNYSLDGIRSRVLGFNLTKIQSGTCTEDPPAGIPDLNVTIGEDCNYFIRGGGWFGFDTPGFTLIAVQDMAVTDQLPDGQGFISSDNGSTSDLDNGATTEIDGLLNITRVPAALPSLTEGNILWQFNQGAANALTERDKFFNLNITTRMLNDAVDASAAPNLHAAASTNIATASFEAIFDTQTITVNEAANIPGYPLQSVRRIDLTVTEPSLTLVKRVCNETRYGAGTACSNFVALANDGDTQDSYIYRVQITNQAASAGTTRAPAYDVTAIDTLDALDQMLIVSTGSNAVSPFLTDGLDNDGDGIVDEADENTGIGGDGVDNDNDGLFDGADSDERVISDNTLENSIPAVITSSYTTSAALQRIDPGDTVTFYYRVNPADSIAPFQTMTNTVLATYDTLNGDFGNQNAPPLDNFETTAPNNTGRARLYTAPSVTAQVRILPLVTQPKSITASSNTGFTGSPQNAAVGEEIQYLLSADIPIANLRNFVIRDELPLGVSCVEAQTINLNAAPYSDAGFNPGGTFTATCTDSLVEWNFGNQELTTAPSGGGLFTFNAVFTLRVENSTVTQEACQIRNGGSTNTAGVPDPVPPLSACSSNPTLTRLTYTDEASNTVTLNYAAADIFVREPVVVVTKSFLPVTAADADNILLVTVTAQNTSTTVSAFNLQILDDLVGLNMTYQVGSEAGATPPDNVDVTTLTNNQPIFNWDNPASAGYELSPGETISFTFQVQADAIVQPHEILDNTLETRWTSLQDINTVLPRINTGAARTLAADGNLLGMRNGQLSGVSPTSANPPNDYNTTAAASVVVPEITITKTDSAPAALTSTIGDHRQFQIVISLPEGISNAVQVTDDLDALAALGETYVLENDATYDITYTFQDIELINGVAPSEAAFTSFPADETAASATWNIGTVDTASEDDPTTSAVNPQIIINYFARINNDVNTDVGDNLQNNAALNYTNGETPATTEVRTDNTDAITVIEPLLTVNKTWSNQTPGKAMGDEPDAGDILEYEITIVNTGNATAYDINIKDAIPANIQWDGTCAPKAIINPGAGITCATGVTNITGFTATPLNQPAGPLIWGRGNTDENLDLNAGDTLVLIYQTAVANTVQIGETITNSAVIDWTSLNGTNPLERNGGTPVADCSAVVAPNDYCAGPATATATVPNPNTLIKAYTSDSFAPINDANLRIGDTVQYTLTLTLQEGTNRDIDLVDSLPNGMEFVSVDSVNGAIAAPYSAVAPFTHADIAAPIITNGAGINTVTWVIGDVVNVPDNNAANDNFVIVYTAQVVNNEIEPEPPGPNVAPVNTTEILTNTIAADFNNFSGANTAILDTTLVPAANANASINAQQPIITLANISKVRRSGTPSGTSLSAADTTMDFRLTACNTGDAPAYNVLIEDILDTPWLLTASIAGPVNGLGRPDIYVNTALVTNIDADPSAVTDAGADYEYELIVGAPTSSMRVKLTNVAINPGQCMDVDYNVNIDPAVFVPPGNQSWDNTLQVIEYHSLPITDINNALRETWGPTGVVIFNMNTFNAGGFVMAKTLQIPAAPYEATIGDQITYQIVMPVTPVGFDQFDVKFTDDLHDSLLLENITDVSINAALSTCEDGLPANDCSIVSVNGTNLLDFEIDLIEAGEQIVIDVIVRVDNNATAQNTLPSFGNSASYTFAATSGGSPIIGATGTTSFATNLSIVEPQLTLQTKTVANVTPGKLATAAPDAGDILRYTLSIAASGGATFSDAFDLSIADTLGLGLLYSGNPTVTDSGLYTNVIGVPDNNGGDGVSTQQILNWSLGSASPSNIDITAGDTITVTYEVVVVDQVLANQALTNSASIQWTSLNGVSIYERDGSGVLNDYANGPLTATITSSDANAVAKSKADDTFNPADDNMRVGDLVSYQLDLNLQEGTHNNLIVNDVLPQGMVFVGIQSIGGDSTASYSAAAPFTYTDIPAGNITVAGDPVTGPTTLSINMGNVLNAGDNNIANNILTITYWARVLNNDAHPQINNISLQNSATYRYDTATTPSTTTASIYTLNLLQPNLAVTKSATQEFGNPIVVAGEDITYTVTITNNGTAPAYDMTLRDTLPLGMRLAGVTTTSIQLPVGNVLANFAPTYDPVTGIANWDFDNGTNDAYTILPGQSLQLVYTAEVDGTVGGAVTLDNSAQVQLYYSFDNDGIPAGAVVGDREVYGPSVAAVYSMTTPAPSPLDKVNPAITNASIGVPFTYSITVPETPVATALYDLRILDNMLALAPNVQLIFVDVQKLSGSQPWVPVNTGLPPDADTNLVIEDTTTGIDIPAGEQVSVNLTVQLQNTSNNSDGDVFQNTASYTFNRVDNDVSTQETGGGDTTANMTIVEPLTMVLTKTAPPLMQFGVPGTFTIDVQNTGNGPAYDLTITDYLPDPTTGGMCDTAPNNFTAEIRDAGNAVQQTLTNAGPTPDFTTTLTPSTTLGTETTCTLNIIMQSANAVMQPGWHLVVNYYAYLDDDNFNGDLLFNYAAASQWFSGDTPAGAAVGEIRRYPRPVDPPSFDLNDPGTPLVIDHQDRAFTTVAAPELVIEKTVFNVATNLLAVTAEPTESLRYQITIRNIGPVAAVDFSLSDEIDKLNPAPGFFVASSLVNVSVIEADATNTIVVTPAGGTNATGLLQISDLDLDAAGGNDVLTITFETTLEAVIDSGNIIRNQAEITLAGFSTLLSDDPAQPGIDDPTETRVGSSPLFQLQKTSIDITGDPNILNRGDVLTYTISAKNIGAEDAQNTLLHDQVPANTTYVPSTTTLNGVFINDPATGISPLQAGFLINATGNATAGFMSANADPADTSNIATITFNVTVNSNVVNGTVISNQAYVSGDGVGSGAFAEQLSDDPATEIIGDPTRNIVGNVAIIDAQKTAVQRTDNNGDDLLDPLEIIRYTIVIQNSGLMDATGVVLTDAVPANTTYVANSLTMKSDVPNGFGNPTLLPVGQPDGGVLPLITGVDVSSSDLIAPLPAAGAGTISPGATVTVAFDVMVNAGTANGTVISNQGQVISNEFPDELTDVDGNDTNGDQPTLITVGSTQQLSIVKNVFVVGGGTAQPGGQLQYLITVTNNGNSPIDLRNQIPNPAVPPNPFFIPNPVNEVLKLVDDIEQLGLISYVPGSARLNGAIDPNVTYDGQRLTVNFDTSKRAVSNFYQFNPGDSFTVRYLVDIDINAVPGSNVVNTAAVDWGTASLSPLTAPIQCSGATPNVDACSVSTLAIGGAPGVATLSGNAWHDSNFDLDDQPGERNLAGWEVQVYFGQGTVNPGDYLDSVFTNSVGDYSISGLVPNINDSKLYAIRFLPPGASTDTASLGNADSIFTDGPQQITLFDLNNSSNTVDMNMPIQPNGVVYNAITRQSVPGVTLQLLNGNGAVVPAGCFDDPVQQNQRTTADGYYKFELNFSDALCPTNNDYSVVVTQTPTSYIDYDLNLLDTVVDYQSRIIPPLLSLTDPTGFNVQTCTGDAQAATPQCEVLPSEFAPTTTTAPRTAGTNYYMKFNLLNFPTDDQLYNNHIALDPVLTDALAISKTSGLVNVTRSQLVPYTITLTNSIGAPVYDIDLIDNYPAGFKYIQNSARIYVDDVRVTTPALEEPTRNGLQLTWPNLVVNNNVTTKVKMLLVVGSGVSEGEYINRVFARNNRTLGNASGEANATVRVVPDPTFDCSDVIGKVFNDKNLNGYQDEGEKGIASARVVSAKGLKVTADRHGRFHITCAIVPNEDRGSNFILKLDERSLPSGYRMTTENPRVQKATRGKMLKFNFGAAIHRVVRLDMADAVFEENSTRIRTQWLSRLDTLIEQLQKQASILRLSYLGDIEDEALVERRIRHVKNKIVSRWKHLNCCYKLKIETELFWRRGAPADREAFKE